MSATTKQCYEQIEEGGTANCGCDNCANFALAREQAYPPELMAVFDSLGIDFRKESEVHHYGRTPAGLHTYRGWFYVIRSIEDGPECWTKLEDKKLKRRVYRVSPSFE